MITKYGTNLSNQEVCKNLTRIGNQIFKLLPMREEEKDWLKPLQTLTVEVVGLNSLLNCSYTDLLTLASKLEGILTKSDIDFWLFRRTIFECCGLASNLKVSILSGDDDES